MGARERKSMREGRPDSNSRRARPNDDQARNRALYCQPTAGVAAGWFGQGGKLGPRQSNRPGSRCHGGHYGGRRVGMAAGRNARRTARRNVRHRQASAPRPTTFAPIRGTTRKPSEAATGNGSYICFNTWEN